MKNGNPYNELKSLTDAVYSGKQEKYGKQVIGILSKYSIRKRQKDGVLHSINISIPRSKKDSILVGLRYLKKDKTYTEDHFLFKRSHIIAKFYQGKVENILPEYKGTHKLQVE